MKVSKVKFVSKKQREKKKELVKQTSDQFPVVAVASAAVSAPAEENYFAEQEEEEDELVPLEIKRKPKNSILEESMHWSQKPLENMTARDWRIAMEDYQIKSSDTIKPLRSWYESKLSPELIQNLTMRGFKTPMGIQRGAIPTALDGKDLLCLAPTGSGKSLAFCLPLITKLLSMGERDTPRALILAPTRELALQIESELLKFNTKLRLCSIIGGRSYQESLEKLELGVDIVVGTPGRLIDTVKLNHLTLTDCDMLVIDEADQMITMGFQVQLEELLKELPQNRQTLMFSATMPQSVEQLTKTYLKYPIRIQVGDVNKVVDTIHEITIKVPNEDVKLSSMIKELKRSKNKKTIIFVNYQATCDELFNKLQSEKIPSVTLHGGKNQSLREEAIGKFRDQCDVLIATDVAGRGIDLDVQVVINYHEAKNDEQYTHRVGRTGRAGRQGKAINFEIEEDRNKKPVEDVEYEEDDAEEDDMK